MSELVHTMVNMSIIEAPLLVGAMGSDWQTCSMVNVVFTMVDVSIIDAPLLVEVMGSDGKIAIPCPWTINF